MRRKALTLSAFAMVFALAPAPAFAAEAPPEALAMATPAAFSAADNTVVRVYFARNPVIWTGIPPELARNFARGKTLPDGIATDALPPALAARLPARPGYRIVRVGQDLAMVDTSTRVVVDVMESVFR